VYRRHAHCLACRTDCITKGLEESSLPNQHVQLLWMSAMLHSMCVYVSIRLETGSSSSNAACTTSPHSFRHCPMSCRTAACRCCCTKQRCLSLACCLLRHHLLLLLLHPLLSCDGGCGCGCGCCCGYRAAA
jgi:hypothetical protein